MRCIAGPDFHNAVADTRVTGYNIDGCPRNDESFRITKFDKRIRSDQTYPSNTRRPGPGKLLS